MWAHLLYVHILCSRSPGVLKSHLRYEFFLVLFVWWQTYRQRAMHIWQTDSVFGKWFLTYWENRGNMNHCHLYIQTVSMGNYPFLEWRGCLLFKNVYFAMGTNHNFPYFPNISWYVRTFLANTESDVHWHRWAHNHLRNKMKMSSNKCIKYLTFCLRFSLKLRNSPD